MINSAAQIIGGVPAQNLDPFLLAKSQTKESAGFITIAYDVSPDETQHNTGSMSARERFYDLLFFKGASVYECARLNQDLRFIVNGDTAQKTFETHRHSASTLVFLYQAPEELILQFRSTFYYEPCLKVQIGSLSKKQIVTLLRASRCRHGIVECNEFTDHAPAIHLTEIKSEEELTAFNPTLKHGRLLLYDIDKNREIINERYSRSSDDLSTITSTNVDHSLSQPIAPFFRMGNTKMGNSRMGNGAESTLSKAEAPVLSKAEADEFTEFIQQILNSPMSTDESHPQGEKKHQMEESEETRTGIVVRVQEELRPIPDKEKTIQLEPATRDKCIDKRSTIETQGKKCSRESKNRAKGRIKASARQLKPASDETGQPSATLQSQQSEYVRTFERLFRSFRQQVFEYFGDRCEDVIARAEKKVRFLSPEFDCHALTDDTAPSILDVVEVIIKEASFMKRSKLRQAAITLISDLYNKQYNLLEQHSAIDRVEQVYYRLKK